MPESDSYPKGKRKDISLREKEKNIQKELDDGINPDGGNMTVLELVQKCVNREAITRKQEREFLRFIKEDKYFCKYYDGICSMLLKRLRQKKV